MGAGKREDSAVSGKSIVNFPIISLDYIFAFSPSSDVDWSQEFDRFRDHDKNGNDMAVKLKRFAFSNSSLVPLGLY